MPNNSLLPGARSRSLTRGTTGLTIGGSPHLRSDNSTRGVMLDLLIALAPALLISVFFYGFRTLTLALTGAASCIAFEWLYRTLLKKPNTTGDMSAAVSGVLLVFGLPASAPYWLVVVGAAFAMVVVKQLYGGIGKNFLNPALAAKAFLLICFPKLMTAWTEPFSYLSIFGNVAADGAVDPLASLMGGLLPAENWFALLLGRSAGRLGDGCALVLLLGGCYLCLRRVISPRVPLIFLGTVAALTFAFPLGGANRIEWMLAQLLSGSLVLAAVFMATDYSTSPMHPLAQAVYAVGCGALTVLLRYLGLGAEPVVYAVLAMNLAARPLDRLVRWVQRRGRDAGEVAAPVAEVAAVAAGDGAVPAGEPVGGEAGEVAAVAAVEAGETPDLADDVAVAAEEASSPAAAKRRPVAAVLRLLRRLHRFAEPPRVLECVPISIVSAGLIAVIVLGIVL